MIFLFSLSFRSIAIPLLLMYGVLMLLIPSQLGIANTNEAKSQKGTYRGENKSGGMS